jgi:Tfp pilus assembly protein PilF
MMRVARLILAALFAIALGACSSAPVQQIKTLFQSKGEPQLQAGVKLYEDGRYREATASFQSALTAGVSDAEQVTANKYLAFISCVSGRERQCRAYFTRALELDPSFELEPAEAGHPKWGPVFRSVKARRKS